MFRRTSRVVAGPPDNRKIGVGPLNLRPFRDPDARGFIWRWTHWTHLRGRWDWVEQATDRNRHRQLYNQSVHGYTPSRIAQFAYGIAGLGTGWTPQIAAAHGGSLGVGIRSSLPWVFAEPPDMQVPVKVSRFGYGLV